MNPILIVLPILSLLMFDLGLCLSVNDFRLLLHRPLPVAIGFLGQMVVLPAVAFLVAWLFGLTSAMFVGIILVACCPGGSSSNIFSKLAGGDVALSVTLTALSSVATLLTLPPLLALTVSLTTETAGTAIHLPVGNLLIQNIVLMAVPIILGGLLRHLRPTVAATLDAALSRVAFPALMLLVAIFFWQHHRTISAHISLIGPAVVTLILGSITAASLLSRLAGQSRSVRRTITIEVAMQNAAQAIAIASSPFVLNDDTFAIPAIIYALMMNIVLLTYVVWCRHNPLTHRQNGR